MGGLKKGVAAKTAIPYLISPSSSPVERLFVFSVDLPATVGEVTVPSSFLSVLPACDEAKVEVLAMEAGNNATITEEEVDCP